MPHATIDVQVDDQKQSTGYQVHLYAGSVCVAEYSAGGNPHDSQAPGCCALSVSRDCGYSTACEMFEEQFGRPPKRTEIEITYVDDEGAETDQVL